MDKSMYDDDIQGLGGNGGQKVIEFPCECAEIAVELRPESPDTQSDAPEAILQAQSNELKPVDKNAIKIMPQGPVSTITGKVKLNCWEFKKCGREPGGVNAVTLGVCPVTVATTYDGLHDGKNAGRACWAVPFATTDGKMSFATKIRKCTQCDFHHLVISEEEKYQSALKHLKKFNKEERAKLLTEKKAEIFKQPGLVRHIFEKSKHTAYGEDAEVDSMFITLLIGWVSLCPSISILAGSLRVCKDDLIDELMVIDAIADNPRRRAAKTVFKTMFKAARKQFVGYFDPLVGIVKKKNYWKS
ncbi:MAG: hypothetical protein HQK97_04715 [Nitrospirae bacterium]|nr:hypothetical protein [Nitrospirota bacterium]